jgi:chromosome segregation ATPase
MPDSDERTGHNSTAMMEELAALSRERDRLRERVAELASAIERLARENRRIEAEKTVAETALRQAKLDLYVLRSDYQRAVDLSARFRDRLTHLEGAIPP